MSLNFRSPTTFTNVLIGDTATSDTPSLTEVNGAKIPAVLELQSTNGAFVPPRMTGVQANALSPFSPGMTLYVQGGHAAPFNADGLYIRGAATWNLVAGTGALSAVMVDPNDGEPSFSVPVWKSGGMPELMSTTVRIEDSNTMMGVSAIIGAQNPPDTFPIYGMNPSNIFVSTEGMGTKGVGTLNFYTSGAVQAEVTGPEDTGNILRFTGGTPGNQATIEAISLAGDMNVSINLKPKGTGFIGIGNGVNYLLLQGGDVGQSAKLLATGTDTDVSLSIDTKGAGQTKFSVDGALQALISGSSGGDGTNYLTILGGATGSPVRLQATGSDTDISFEIGTNGVGQILSSNSGTQMFPSYSFSSDIGSGIYSPSANVLGFAAGGALQAQVITVGNGTNYLSFFGGDTTKAPGILATGSDTDVSFNMAVHGNGQIIANSNGSFSAPMWSFKNHTGIGMYTDGTNLGLSTDTVQASIVAATFSIPVSVNGTVYYLKASTSP